MSGARRRLEANAFESARLLRVAEVGVEDRLPVRIDEDGGVRAREPGQVADVDAAGDEQRLLEERGQPFEATHRCSARNAIAVR